MPALKTVPRHVLATGGGLVMAAVPALARAQENSRALGAPADLWPALLVTALALGALFVAAAVGYLYRRERGLTWDFQRPDRDEHDDAH